MKLSFCRKKITVIYFFLLFSHISSAQYSGGDGSSINPFEIDNLNDLETLSNSPDDWESYFILTADIDASSTIGWNGGEGFSPIGNEITNFRGSFNGQNYKVLNLFIDRPTQNFVGFFGYVREFDKIENLGLENVTIIGNDYVGGLIGLAADLFATSQVINSYSSGQVTGLGQGTGGFVGSAGSQMFGCYSSCVVNGTTHVGGYIGSGMFAVITNCYATGDVFGVQFVGGFAGSNDEGSIINSYSAGFVSGNDYVEGFIGLSNLDSFINNCYVDTLTAGLSDYFAQPKTTQEMKTQSTFSSWNFNDIWIMEACNTFGYPSLIEVYNQPTGPINTISENENILTADEAGASYQWLDCDNAGAPIIGETDQTFIPTANGSYAVEVTKNGCSVTSSCTEITTLGLNDASVNQFILRIYPNPSVGVFQLETSLIGLTYVLTDLSGRVIARGITNSNYTIIDIKHEESGIYLLKINEDLLKLVKL